VLAEATYGHGKELFGNDCLDHIKHVQGVPAQVDVWSQYDRVEVRGEVIISLEEFACYGKAGKSPRSTSNGIMSKKVAVKDECKRLEFHPFRLIMDGVIRHMPAMQALERNGFKTSGFVSALNLEKTDAELEQDIENIVCSAEVERESLPYPTDGLVFKFDNYDYYDRIGNTDHDAKYNCAFKFRPVFKAVTTYRGHHTTIGEKTGKITFVADFDEVEMNGHRFAHANCGSEKTFNQKGLVAGCKIEVSLHGDVIVCVDGKVEEEPEINQSQEPEVEPCVIEPEINQSLEPEPIPQPKPKRKRNYPQVGEPTLREEREDTTVRVDKSLTGKKVLAGVLAVLMAVSMGVVMLAFAGAAVFLMPMIGGLRKE
jgi:DNA ligase (NAD+)